MKRKTGTSKATESVNSDSDTEVNVPVLPTKKHRSSTENGHPAKGNSKQEPMIQEDIDDLDSDSRFNIGDEFGVTIKGKGHALVLEKSKGLSTQSSHGGNELSIDSRDVDSPNPGLKLAEAIQSRPKHAATQLKEVPKARVSFASARTTGTPKPFVPLDPASIRRGFQAGGANSKTEDLKKGTSRYILPMDKTISS